MKQQLLFIALFFSLYCKSQIMNCGSDVLREQLNSSNPQYAKAEEDFNQREYLAAQNGTLQNTNRTVVTIPVVVHVIHQNGPENLPDSTIIQSINQLNLRFQNAPPYYDADGTDIGIQFCLASFDPMGNPTNGITRDISNLTYSVDPANNAADVALKDVNRWEPLLYMNIWVVNSIVGLAGFSSYPSWAGNTRDGIVVGYPYLNSPTLTHEVGHYFYLYHTFEGGCYNLNCMLNGDHVCDTPPDNSAAYVFPCLDNSCSTDALDTTGLSPFATDVNNIFDYMDYTNCPDLFTAGQSVRMNDALYYFRSLLLQSNGCGQNPVGPPIAAYLYNIGVCNNGDVTFTDASSNYAVSYHWDFDNDGIYDATGNPVTHVFPATGTYTVKEYVQGVAGYDTISHTFFVQHAPTLFYPLANIAGTYYDAHSNKAACRGEEITLTATAGATSYLWFTGETTQVIHITADTSFTIWVQITDSNGLAWTSQTCTATPIIVYPAIPPFAIYDNDSTIVCYGETVDLHSTISSPLYTYQWVMANLAISGATDSIYSFAANGSGVNYWLTVADSNGCHRNSDTIIISSIQVPSASTYYISANGFTLTSNFPMGTQWFQDNVPIQGATSNTYTVVQPGCYFAEWYFYPEYNCGTYSDTICFVTVGTNEINAADGITISPNPFTSQTMISFSEEQKNTTIKITDVLGKEIKTVILSGARNLVLEKGEMEKGIYFVQIMDEKKNVVNRKIIIQ